MGIITLTTDFGDKDGYAGVMKGVILGICSQAVIIDITHRIDPQDLVQAGFIIRSSYRFFPRATVHVIVVDPGVGTGRAVVAFESAGHYFIGPDNGVLSLVRDEGEIRWLVAVDNPDLFFHPISDTFHGRDIFAPVAAHLLNGVSLDRLGSPMDPDDMVNLDYQAPKTNANGDLIGTIIDVDRFGNLITDIDVERIDVIRCRCPGKTLIVIAGNQSIKGLATTYQDRRPGTFVAYIGSRKFLEIAVNQGSAASHLDIGKGESVKMSVSD